MQEDIRCQWCHKVIMVALQDEGEWMAVAEAVLFMDKYYCSGESGKCWDELHFMTDRLQGRAS